MPRVLPEQFQILVVRGTAKSLRNKPGLGQFEWLTHGLGRNIGKSEYSGSSLFCSNSRVYLSISIGSRNYQPVEFHWF